MKKVLLHSRSLIWNRKIGISITCEFAPLETAYNEDSLSWKFALLGIAQLRISKYQGIATIRILFHFMQCDFYLDIPHMKQLS
uniref:Uncharacterized protein n=1 Tax=Romanomermis culicivorax TaxID=13658 RepID=A0A915HYB0_ROMCU